MRWVLSTGRRSLALVIPGLMLLFAQPQGAAATAGHFSEPVTLTPQPARYPYNSGFAFYAPLDLAMSPSGGAVLAFTRSESLTSFDAVEATSRAPGGAFSAVADLTPTGDSTSASATDSSATVTWEPGVLGTGAADTSLGGAFFAAAQQWRSDIGGNLNAADPAGDAIQAGYGQAISSNAAACRRAGGQFADPNSLGFAEPVAVGIDPAAGEGFVIDREASVPPGTPPVPGVPVRVGFGFRECRPDGTLTSRYVLTPPTDDTSVTPATYGVNSKGDLLIAWEDAGEGGAPLQYAYRPAGGSFEPTKTFPVAFYGRIALDESGNAVIFGWTSGHPGSVYIPAGGTAQPPQVVPGSEGAFTKGAVGFDSAGTAVAIWPDQATWGGPGVVKVSERPPGGSWTPAQPLTDSPSGVCGVFCVTAIGFDAQGRGLAAWMQEPQQTVYLASYNAPPPVLAGMPGAPSTATRTAPLVSKLRVMRRRRRPPLLTFRATRKARVTITVDVVTRRARAARTHKIVRLSLVAHAGRNAVSLRRVFHRGRYRLILSARAGASSLTRRLSFHL